MAKLVKGRRGEGNKHTLVVRGTARAGKAHVAQVRTVCVGVGGGHATMGPAGDRHRRVGVCVGAGHGAVGRGVSEVCRGAAGDAWRKRVLLQAGGRRVELVGEGVVVKWWG